MIGRGIVDRTGRALAEEAKAILAAMPDRSYKIAMCVEGKQLSSEEFSEKLDGELLDEFNDIIKGI